MKHTFCFIVHLLEKHYPADYLYSAACRTGTRACKKQHKNEKLRRRRPERIVRRTKSGSRYNGNNLKRRIAKCRSERMIHRKKKNGYCRNAYCNYGRIRLQFGILPYFSKFSCYCKIEQAEVYSGKEHKHRTYNIHRNGVKTPYA